MRNLSGTYKGLITGALMVIVSLLIYYVKDTFQSPLQYIVYAIYIAGIYWTIDGYSKMTQTIHSFRSYFSQGFRCFIVVTLVMVAFTYIFMKSDPNMLDEMAANYRTDLQKQENLTPDEIERKVDNARTYFIPMFLSSAIFAYLAIGAVISAIISGFMVGKRGKNIDQDHTSFTGTKI